MFLFAYWWNLWKAGDPKPTPGSMFEITTVQVGEDLQDACMATKHSAPDSWYSREENNANEDEDDADDNFQVLDDEEIAPCLFSLVISSSYSQQTAHR